MLYSIKNVEDLHKLNELIWLKDQVREIQITKQAWGTKLS